MARNSQVEMVTAFRWGEFSRMVLPVQRTVLTTETDGRETAICVGFTGIIKEELPGAHHKGAGGHPGGGQNYLGNLLYHGAGAAGRVEEGTLGRGGLALAAAAATLLILGIIRHGKRKKRQENAMLDR